MHYRKAHETSAEQPDGQRVLTTAIPHWPPLQTPESETTDANWSLR